MDARRVLEATITEIDRAHAPDMERMVMFSYAWRWNLTLVDFAACSVSTQHSDQNQLRLTKMGTLRASTVFCIEQAANSGSRHGLNGAHRAHVHELAEIELVQVPPVQCRHRPRPTTGMSPRCESKRHREEANAQDACQSGAGRSAIVVP